MSKACRVHFRQDTFSSGLMMSRGIRANFHLFLKLITYSTKTTQPLHLGDRVQRFRRGDGQYMIAFCYERKKRAAILRHENRKHLCKWGLSRTRTSVKWCREGRWNARRHLFHVLNLLPWWFAVRSHPLLTLRWVMKRREWESIFCFISLALFPLGADTTGRVVKGPPLSPSTFPVFAGDLTWLKGLYFLIFRHLVCQHPAPSDRIRQ